MEVRTLGNSDLRVSAIGLGCNNFADRTDFPATERIVHKAIDLGITFFDTADAYGKRGGSEEYIGRTLGARRKDIVLATKFGLPMADGDPPLDTSRRHIMEAVEASLRRLRTDWIDLYQMHRPDGVTPTEETLRALHDLVRQGKVRHIGCSNVTAEELREADNVARTHGLTPFVSCQDQYSVLVRGVEREVLPAVSAARQSFIPYFPLASGLLTGKYQQGAPMPAGSRLSYSKRHINRFVHDAYWTAVEKLEAFCRTRNRTLLELAFGWLLGNPLVASVIAGATRPEQLEDNARASTWRLSAEERAEVDRITADLPPPPGPE